MGDRAAMFADITAALEQGDWAGVGEAARKHATPDFATEWPQSGERLSLEGVQKMSEMYEAGSGTSPTFTFKRLLDGGDVFVIEGTIDYGDGIPVRYVGVGELRDEKVSRLTEYFANPFPAPDWRASIVERYEP
jgi:hypothetical protein